VLLEAFWLAYSQNRALRLLMLGSGSEAPLIREFIKQHHLQGVIFPVGLIRNEELPMWFRVADAYVSCARSDGTSVSLLEAMATGLPVIVTDIPSNREWVTEGDNGWLAEANVPEAFAGHMLRAAKLSSQERAEIGWRNEQVVTARADWDKNFPRLLQMYDCLVRSPAKSEP
jgi:glycosyltransferase involved in cell wall biosynthesis